MVNDFPRTLSLLRQEKKISQRQASGALGVSQALLSHYENGMREPGLSFVVRAADYYSVSADYLLGRTMSRDGSVIAALDVTDSSEVKDNVLRGSASAMLGKKLIVNSVALLFDLIGNSSDKALAQDVCNYLGISFYKAYRFVYMMNKNNPQGIFAASECNFSELCDAELKKCEAKFRGLISECEKKDHFTSPDISIDAMRAQYPQLAPSLLSVLHSVAERLEKNNK